MKVTFFKAKCLEDIWVNGLNVKCLAGETYTLNHWQARAYAGAFDLKNATMNTETVEMDTQEQSVVQSAIDKKDKLRQEFIDGINAKPGVKKVKAEVPREEVIGKMSAGLINELLVKYNLPKLNHLDKNRELALAYENTMAEVQKLTPEQKVEALQKLEIEIPTEGDFDQSAALAQALTMQNVDEADVAVKQPRAASNKKDKKAK